MFPSGQFHQEIARNRHAELLREVRLQRVASIEREERERGPLNRIRHLLEARGLMHRRRGKRDLPRSLPGPVA